MPLILRRPLSAPHFSPTPLILRRLLSAPSFGRHFPAMPLILRRPPERPLISYQCPSLIFVNGEWGVRYLLVTSPHSLVVNIHILWERLWHCPLIRTSFLTNAPHLRLPSVPTSYQCPSFRDAPDRPLNAPHFSTMSLILRRSWARSHFSPRPLILQCLSFYDEWVGVR